MNADNGKKTVKKSIIIMILLALLLCAEAFVLLSLKKRNDHRSESLSAGITEQSFETASEDEEPDMGQTLPCAAVRAKEFHALLRTLDRGDRVELIGPCPELEGYYIVRSESDYGMVEKRFLATNEYKAWSGYGVEGGLYADADMSVYVRGLDRNEKLEIIDDFGSCYYVIAEDGMGFAWKNCVSASRLRAEDNAYPDENTGGTGDSGVIIGGGGGTSGGSTGGGTAGGGTGGSKDGGDISLSFTPGYELMQLSYAAPQSGEPTGEAMIRADGTELILAVLFRGDTVGVVSQDGDVCTVSINGVQAYIPRQLLRCEGEAEYAQWQGYTDGRGLFEDMGLCSLSAVGAQANTPLTVVDEFEDCLLVSIGGELSYIEKQGVSREPALTQPPENIPQRDNPGQSTDGGDEGGGTGDSGVVIGGGGGTTGGGTSGGGSEGGGTSGGSTPEWSVPVL